MELICELNCLYIIVHATLVPLQELFVSKGHVQNASFCNVKSIGTFKSLTCVSDPVNSCSCCTGDSESCVLGIHFEHHEWR